MLSAVAKPPAAPRVGPDVIAWGRHFDDLTHRPRRLGGSALAAWTVLRPIQPRAPETVG